MEVDREITETVENLQINIIVVTTLENNICGNKIHSQMKFLVLLKQ